MWKDNDTILFTCVVKETGKECLSGGWVKMNSSQASSNLTSSSSLKSEAVFEEMKKRMESHKDIVAKVGAVFQWNITKNGKLAGQWG